MVQQLSLWGAVSDDECGIVLKTLAAVSGMNPRAFETLVELWEPVNPFKPQLAAGQVNQIEQYRIFLHDSRELEIQEVPEPGKNAKVISQTLLKANIRDGNPEKFLNSLGYELKSNYMTKGHEFVFSRKGPMVQVFRLYDSEKTLLDTSGQWIVKAFIDVGSVTDLPAVQQATSELEQFQQNFKGIVSLQIPSRGYFNTRIRRT